MWLDQTTAAAAAARAAAHGYELWFSLAREGSLLEECL
jgi:hypothetical protein